MDRRTRRMEEAAREGRTEDAQRELAELEEMLKALEEGRCPRREPERQQHRERGQQQMGVVQDMVRRQARCWTAATSAPIRTSAPRPGSRQRAPAAERWPPSRRRRSARSSGPERSSSAQDGRPQRALRRALGELMQQFGDLTGEVPEPLGRADQAMREAQEALGQAATPAPPSSVRSARCRRAAGRWRSRCSASSAGARRRGGGRGGHGRGDQPGGEGPDQAQGQGEGRDPLGRRSRDVNGNADNGGDTRVPDEAEMLRTRKLQDELRRRGAERERPAEELDYIDRLLRRF